MPVDMCGEFRLRRRVLTGIYSLDHAFENPQMGEIGIPMSVMELYGSTGCGKTTLSWFLAAEAAKTCGKFITMMNIEVFDYRYAAQVLDFYGFDGKVYIAGGDTDEKMFDDAEDHLRDKGYASYVMDSVGAISPIAEMEGDSGAANMGRRARLVNAHVRKVAHVDRNKDTLAIFINHVHPNLGTVGSTTPGGKTLQYLSATRIRVKKSRENPYKDGSFTIEGTVIKNRFGVEKRLFWVFVLAGIGVHKGLSSVYDCIQLGLLKKDKGARAYKWAATDEKIPAYSALIDAARCGETEVFLPFSAALNEAGVTAIDEKADDE